MCAGRFSLQRAQVTSVGALAFHWERRLRVLDRDILRLGTGTVVPFLWGAQSLAGFCCALAASTIIPHRSDELLVPP